MGMNLWISSTQVKSPRSTDFKKGGDTQGQNKLLLETIFYNSLESYLSIGQGKISRTRLLALCGQLSHVISCLCQNEQKKLK